MLSGKISSLRVKLGHFSKQCGVKASNIAHSTVDIHADSSVESGMSAGLSDKPSGVSIDVYLTMLKTGLPLQSQLGCLANNIATQGVQSPEVKTKLRDSLYTYLTSIKAAKRQANTKIEYLTRNCSGNPKAISRLKSTQDSCSSRLNKVIAATEKQLQRLTD